MLDKRDEVYAFLDAKVPEIIRTQMKQIFDKIEERADEKTWEHPGVGQFPEDGGYWMIWWNNLKHHIAIDWDKENKPYYFFRDRTKNTSIGEELDMNAIPEDFIDKVLKFKNRTENSDDDAS